jgi:acyl carrier protein
MKKEIFFKMLVNELELENDEINDQSILNLTSLKQLSLISFLDEHFSLRIKAVNLKGIDSVEKLILLIGRDKFE